MKYLSIFILGLAILGRSSPTPAQSDKPAMVYSLPSVDRTSEIFSALHDLSDSVPLDKWNTLRAKLAGLDSTKPCGMRLYFDGVKQVPIVLFPGNPKALTKLYEDLLHVSIDPKEIGNDSYEFKYAGENAVMMGKGGWTIVANNVDLLKPLPPDPETLLDGLNKRFDMAIQLNLSNVPNEVRAIVSRNFAELDAPNEVEAGPAVEARQARYEKMADNLSALMIGWKFEARTPKKMLFDINVAAKQGGALAKLLANGDSHSSRFSSFYVADAGFSANATAKLQPALIEQTTSTLNLWRNDLKSQFDKSDDLSIERRKAANEACGELFDVAAATVKAGNVDLGVAIFFAPRASKIVIGGNTANGPAVELAVQKLFDAAKDDWHVEFKTAGEHQGVRFQTIKVPLSEETMQVVFGEELDVYLGFGPKALYLAAGNGSLEMLKNLIDTSAADANKTVPAARVQVGAASACDLFQCFAPSLEVGVVRNTLDESKNLDHLRATVTTKANAASIQVELEEGIVRIIALLSSGAYSDSTRERDQDDLDDAATPVDAVHGASPAAPPSRHAP